MSSDATSPAIGHMNALAMRPLFYDALSGEFSPPSDELGRSHTLGRLAVATFSKGTLLYKQFLSSAPEEFAGRPVDTLHYKPSWANVKVTGILTHMGNDVLAGLGIYSNDGQQRFGVYDISHPDTQSGRGLHLSTPSESQLFPLELGSQLLEARAAVTEAAQQFFDTIT